MSTVLILPIPNKHGGFHPFADDEFFSATQSTRLQELMTRWRHCRDSGSRLDASEQIELESLVNAELVVASQGITVMPAENAE